jgi:hypothetical protein
LYVALTAAACGGAGPRTEAPAAPAIDCDAFARSVPQLSHVSAPVVSGAVVPGARIGGDTEIRPSQDEQAQMIKARVRRVFVGVKVCVGADGAVEGLELLCPSGLPAYDKNVCEQIARWRYRPWQRDGAPVEACTGVSFDFDIMPPGTPP